MVQIFDNCCRHKNQVKIHVVVKNQFTNHFLSKKPNYNPCGRRKIQVLIHLVVEKFKFDPGCRRKIKPLLNHPCLDLIRHHLSMG